MRVIIAAGGTGGHLYPAIALAHEFLRLEPDATVRFVGTSRGIEIKVLPHEGFDMDLITALPVMGVGLRRSLSAFLSLPTGVRESITLLKRHRADLVIGVGGYTTPPVLLAAFLLRIPRVIVEPNAYPGKANTMLGPLAHRIFLGFEAASRYFDSSKVRVVGVPVRRAFLESRGTETSTKGDKSILVFGGSRGAHAINEAMIEALAVLMGDEVLRSTLSITHQTGEADYERVAGVYKTAGVNGAVVPFLFDMPAAFRAADLVVSRSGAMTVAELTVSGKPAILIPFPYAIYQHQAHNADVLAQAGAALVMGERELTGPALAKAIAGLLSDPPRLRAMGERSRTLARTDAVEAIVRECVLVIAQGSRG